MQVLIGISSGATSSVDQYLAPNQMTQADWLRARSVTLTLSFYNPLFNTVASASKTNIDRQGQPRFITLTQVIRLENLGGPGIGAATTNNGNNGEGEGNGQNVKLTNP